MYMGRYIATSVGSVLSNKCWESNYTATAVTICTAR